MMVSEITQVSQNPFSEKQKLQSGEPRKTQDASLKNKVHNPEIQKEIQNAGVPEEKIEVRKVDAEKIKATLQEFVDTIGRELNFEVHDEDNRVVITVIRKSDGAVIRQIPPESMQKLAAGIHSEEEFSGLLLEENA